MRSPLTAIARKEFIQIRRDKSTIYMVFIFPLMMLILYGYGIRYDVKLVPITVFDQDASFESRQYLERFGESPYFSIIRYVPNYRELENDINRGEARLGVVIPPDFGERLSSNREATVQVIVDGADSNTATIALGYFSAITREYSSAVMMNQMEAMIRRTNLSIPPMEIEPRIWFNEDLQSVEFIVPGIIAIIMMIIGTLLTAVTIVKEKEDGTIEQIVSSPIKRHQLMLGKVLPYAVLAYLDFLLVVLASYVFFGVEIRGSVLLLFIVAFFYLLGVLGIGILVSTITETQISAMLIAILVSLLPSILLSGFIFPIRQMPEALQILTTVIPARYFIEILRDIYLKGLGLEAIWREILYIMLFGFVTLVLAAQRFQKRLD